jgi:hypothetical protein
VINVIVTATEVLITSTSTEFPVTVTSDNVLFTVTNQVSNFTVVNQTPTITFATESAVFDLASKNRGEWVNGGVYSRSDIVHYQYSTYICDIAYNTLLTSTTPPPDAPADWELLIFHEWPMAYLNVTNTATINGNLLVNGTSTFVGTTTFTDLTVNNQFIINGLKYPINKGTYGQVLFTGGDETGLAAWVNLGELVFWSLSDDLLTNGFNITSGQGANSPYTHPQLTIGAGVTGRLSSSIKFSAASSGTTGTISMTATSVAIKGNLNVTGNGTFSDNLNVSDNLDVNGTVDFADSLAVGGIATFEDDVIIEGDLGGLSNGLVRLMTGIRFPDGTSLSTAAIGTGTSIVPIATTATLGIIRVGANLAINTETGVLSGTVQTFVLNTATTSTLGGVKIGSGLQINSSTGVLSVNTGSIDLAIATTSSLGVVQVGNGLVITPEGVLSTNVNPGDLPIATTSTLGGIIVGGGGLQVDIDGVLSINSSTLSLPNIGNISLTQDMRTNGFFIRSSTTGTGAESYAQITSNRINVKTTGTIDILATSNTASIKLRNLSSATNPTSIEINTATIQLKAPYIIGGTDVDNSTLQIGRIYNFAGTSAPFFPAGVQYQDNTIQRTAWRGYDQGLI